MKSGKRVFGILIVSLLLIVSISLVSAGIKDWFGFGSDENLEGELPETAVARVKILDVSPPVVVYVSDVNDGSGVVNTVTPNIRTVNNGNIPVKLWFLAQQGGGVGNLDPTPGTFNSNASFIRAGSTTRFNSSCVTLGQVACGTSCTGDAVNYSCTVVMRYYDDPDALLIKWNISAIARDTSNRFGTNSTKQFSVTSTTAASSAVNYLNWTNPPISVVATPIYRYNDPSTNYMVNNDGNSNIPTTRVNATRLVGMTNPAYSILANKFTANPTNPPGVCGGTDLDQDTNPAITGFNVPKATNDVGSQAQLYFCLIDVIGLSSQDYNASRLWKVTFA